MFPSRQVTTKKRAKLCLDARFVGLRPPNNLSSAAQRGRFYLCKMTLSAWRMERMPNCSVWTSSSGIHW